MLRERYGVRLQHVHVSTDGAGEMSNMREGTITGHGVCKCTGCKPVLLVCERVFIWIYSYVGGLLFSFFSQKEDKN